MSAAMQSNGRPTWRQNLAHALTATVLTAVVVTPIFGLHLERAGMRTVIQQNWSSVAWACLLVFVVQMLRPLLPRSSVRLPRFQLPALPARQRGIWIAAALLLAGGALLYLQPEFMVMLADQVWACF